MAGAAAQRSGGFTKDNQGPQKTQHRSLDLYDFEPTSMLQVHESRIEHAKFPVLDFHTHITTSAKSENGVELASERKYLGTPEELLAVMDRKNIRAMVNLTGGYGEGLGDVINKYDRAFPGRFYTFYRALLRTLEGSRLSGTSGPSHRASPPARCEGLENSEDSRSLSSREHYFRRTRKDR